MSNVIKEAMETGEIFYAHRTFGKHFFFPNEDMEFGFTYFLGHITYGGGSLGEMLQIAREVDASKPETWIEATTSMAHRVETRARASLAGGHTISTRAGLLRASQYHRLATALISPRKDTARWKTAHEKARALFIEAAALFDPPMEVLEIPFEGTVLPGYFLKAAADDAPHKTLMMFGGTETFAEDQFFYIAPAALERGYNFMTADLPGQGGLPLQGHFFRPDMETPMKAIVDYALSRSDVDADRLAAYGISGGGYFIPRAAAYEKRIKACIANSMLYDLHRIWKSTLLQFGDLLKKHDPISWFIVDMLAWRWGVISPLGLIKANREFKFDPVLLTCPTLIVIGEGEYQGSKEAQRQQECALEAIRNEKKTLVMAPMNEGAGNHCMGENLPLMSQIVFDWLDDVFA
ncbi:MAG: alpha/beta hydrolase [Anaerolineales bacterium]|nr:alpha/beta hydrolase [Anaerolineales bacterium]